MRPREKKGLLDMANEVSQFQSCDWVSVVYINSSRCTWDYFLLNQQANRNLTRLQPGHLRYFPALSSHLSHHSPAHILPFHPEHWRFSHASVPLAVLFPLSGSLPQPSSINGPLGLIFTTQVPFYSLRNLSLPSPSIRLSEIPLQCVLKAPVRTTSLYWDWLGFL